MTIFLDPKQISSYLMGMNKLPLAKRIQILAMLCEGFVHAVDQPRC